jgi:hypothetical protein
MVKDRATRRSFDAWRADCSKPMNGEGGAYMKITKLKPLMAVVLACYIDLAICGFQSLGSASETVNGMSNWTILRPHTIGQASDGSYFAEVVLLGTDRGDLCYAVWESPVGTYFCPGSSATVSGNFVGTGNDHISAGTQELSARGYNVLL